MKHVLVVTLVDIDPDPRAIKQALVLKDYCKVSYLSIHDPKISGVEHIPIESPKNSLLDRAKKMLSLVFSDYDTHYFNDNQIKSYIHNVINKKFDAILSNDFDSIPASLYLRDKNVTKKVIGDLHEFSPQEFDVRLYWRLIVKPYRNYLCKKYLPLCDKLMTVGSYIANKYKEVFGVNTSIVYNAPTLNHLVPRELEANKIKLVHIGAATRHRKIENMISLMNSLDERFTLDLYLVGNQKYIDELKQIAQNSPRIKFPPAVKNHLVTETLNSYDIGIYILEPRTINDEFCMPNKFFEFIHSKLALAISPNPEMKAIVENYSLGVVASDYTANSLAVKLLGLTAPEIMKFKKNSAKSCQELNFEKSFEPVRVFIVNS